MLPPGWRGGPGTNWPACFSTNCSYYGSHVKLTGWSFYSDRLNQQGPAATYQRLPIFSSPEGVSWYLSNIGAVIVQSTVNESVVS